MTVTCVEPVTKTKSRVVIDGEFAFILYKGELFHYHIVENKEIKEEVYREIKDDVVLKRAKLRALYLLKDMDRTEEQLRGKLRGSEYTEDIIEKALEYVKSFGYVDDSAYARRFVEANRKRKSRRDIYFSLYKKGVPGELIEQTIEECYETEDSVSAIKEIMRKKHYSCETASEKETQKMYAYLVRKGFRYEDVRQVIQVSEGNA